ncbi:MAG: RelA/SpoT family protein, partial [Dehalococcoidia bacterium]|nr:RelA/SpoT family protein [Dehalococcoidia bacterium]
PPFSFEPQAPLRYTQWAMEASGIKEMTSHLSPRKRGPVEEAQHLAQEKLGAAPETQLALKHSVGTGLILAELGLDAATIAAGLLHHLPLEGHTPVASIEESLGPDVARLVEGAARLSGLPTTGTPLSQGHATQADSQAEALRSMLLALAQDLRVVLIRLAEQTEMIGRVNSIPPDEATSIATDTLEVYAPLAHRLGIARLFRDMQDKAFACLEPESYRQMAAQVEERLSRWQEALVAVKLELDSDLVGAGIEADITSRTKHLYSTHLKAQRYAHQGKSFGDIHDLVALRVVVAGIADCYSALGIVHGRWRPLPGEFDDFIATPKDNGYRSLHATVMHQGVPVEVQIRTREMHEVTEYGVAAHWHYKEQRKSMPQEWVSQVRRSLEQHRNLSGEELLESIKTDVLEDKVFVYTPKGTIVELPRGATPLDLAYRIHTELGHQATGARVNDRMVSFTYQLQNGDRVDIMRTRASKGPSRDWLNPALGHVATSHAREKIRQWFKHQQRQENVERGREVVDRELRRLGLGSISYDDLAKAFGVDQVDEFLATVGYGGITAHQIAHQIAPPPPQPPPAPAPQSQPMPTQIQATGVSNLLTRIAGCCRPLPGDSIVGYVTRAKGISIHRQNCPGILHEKETDRLLPVEWGREEMLYPAVLSIRAWDRVGLLRDIGALMAEEEVNIQEIKASDQKDGTALIKLTIKARNLAHLSRLLARLEGIRGIISTIRGGSAPHQERR